MKVLMSIKPEYVEEIFNGIKRFEYRRTIFTNPTIKTVVIYSTKPCGKIVGEFNVKNIFCDNPETLWKRTKDFSGISKESFDRYFEGKEKGFAIEIGEVIKYEKSLALKEFNKELKTPPQSFFYIK